MTRLQTWAWALAMTAGAAHACPEKIPEGLRSEPVGEKLVVNGVPMQIRQVTGKASSAEWLDRAQHEWQNAGFSVKRSRSGRWDVVAARGENCLATLQLMDHEGAVGYFGVSHPARAEPWVDKRLPVRLPGGIELNSAVSSTDDSRRAYTVSFSSKRRPEDLAAYFMSHLDSSGWQAVTQHAIRNGRESASSLIVSARKGNEQISIVLWEQALTRALLNVSESM